jgi:mRNA interferase RelE/StbE
MSYKLLLHPDIYKIDLLPLNNDIRDIIIAAIEKRLEIEPMKYGKRLSGGLKGFWKLRVGDCRVIYRVEEAEVWVLKIGHRKEVYESVRKRLGWIPKDG